MAPASAASRGHRPRPATPTDVSAAIAERRRAEARRRSMRMGGAVALLALAAVAVWLVRFSPVFSVRQVEVQGNTAVSEDEVVRVARVPLGTPMAVLDSQPIAARVATGLTPVARVHVTTRLPGTVRIEVEERQPVFVRSAGGGWQSVDGAGVVFATHAKQPKGAMVVRTPSVDNRLLAEVAAVVEALPPALRSQVVRIDAASPDRITLVLKKGRTVLWGSGAASAQKAAVLEVLLGQEATVYDVSSPSSPSTR